MICLEIELNTYHSLNSSFFLERKRFYNKAGIEEEEGEKNNCSKHYFCNYRTHGFVVIFKETVSCLPVK